MKSQLTLNELSSVVASYIDENKIALDSFSVTRNNIAGLVDKIGKIVTIDTSFYDKLPELDGEELPFGKTVEEYFQDLILAIDWNQDEDGSRAKKFYSPTYRPCAYSYSLGRKVIPQSEPNNNIERAVNNQEQATNIVAGWTKKLEDSKSSFKYACKREMVGKLAELVVSAYEEATTYVASTTTLTEGTTYTNGTSVAVCVKAMATASAKTFAELVADGHLIPLTMLQDVAIPVDETTGENFIKAVKTACEDAGDVSEGNSLNGGTLGAEEGLMLYIKHGVMPSVEVDTYAGAFNKGDLSVNATIKTIKNFGKADSNIYAILVDPRGLKLHPDYDVTRLETNGFGDFTTLLKHVEYTAFISRNAFVKVFRIPQA